MSEQRDGEARVKDDPLTCSKCGGPTRENGRWHPDLGAVFGYELGLRSEVAAEEERRAQLLGKPYPSCLGDCGEDGNYCCDGLWDWRNRPALPQPVSSEEDRARAREEIKAMETGYGDLAATLDAAASLTRVLTDATTLAQYAKERGE